MSYGVAARAPPPTALQVVLFNQQAAAALSIASRRNRDVRASGINSSPSSSECILLAVHMLNIEVPKDGECPLPESRWNRH